MTYENLLGIILLLIGAGTFGHILDINKVKHTNFNVFLATITLFGLMVGSTLLFN